MKKLERNLSYQADGRQLHAVSGAGGRLGRVAWPCAQGPAGSLGRVVLMGGSAGGHLALLAAYTEE